MVTNSKSSLTQWRSDFQNNKPPDQSLDDWVKMFDGIYHKKNEAKDDFTLLCGLFEELGELSEDVRKNRVYPRINEKGEIEGILINVADVMAWLCAFANRYGSLSEAVWHKFPNRCAHCFAFKNCVCVSSETKLRESKHEERLQAYRGKRDGMPTTMRQWQETFCRIYGNVNRIQHPDHVAFHLVEEAGEVVKALRHGETIQLQDEIADVFAWLCGLCQRYSGLSRYEDEMQLDRILWSRYPGICAHCRRRRCVCDDPVAGPRD